MKKLTYTLALLPLLSAAPALAQGTLIGTEALDERIEDIELDVREDLAEGRDADRFGPNQVPQGWRGSFALSGSVSDGNTDEGDLSIAGRLTYGIGNWVHSFGLAGEYGESDGDKDQEEFYATYEGTRYFTPRFYAFGIGRFEYDNFDTIERDAFIGLGPGYRIINQPDLTWRVQAGPGWRYTEDQTGDDNTEFAWIAASRVYYGLTDTVALTNDTEILGSDENTTYWNDLGVNFEVSNTLTTRISYQVEHNTDPLPGFDDTDQSLNVALILGF
ncbi:DUF481 domain-containing protein [Tranquillimonas alkanivorans]|uniref:Putative salt-induced outer membrane protein n=1 Tax=Tranquillimonas alkanivorans TaxID=441119 RepID=A0A1I5PK90_9RHOB|nr:DUF481 domain-containing protein [Tranquillimonas alkanivorans]SFP34423.1 putative salt-induced outer membrane protein [Tranquillimonas alkanivorans]